MTGSAKQSAPSPSLRAERSNPWRREVEAGLFVAFVPMRKRLRLSQAMTAEMPSTLSSLLRLERSNLLHTRHPSSSCESTGRRKAPPDDRLREAIHGRIRKEDGLLRCARNDSNLRLHILATRMRPSHARIVRPKERRAWGMPGA